MCIPSGYALGYIYGGFISLYLVGSHFGWRYAFWIESILMLPFAIFRFLVKPLHLQGFIPAELITVQVCETVALGIQVTNASIGKDESLSLKAEYKDKSSNDQSKSKSATKMFHQVSSFLVQLHLCLQWELLPF
ncbi:hypothetical protein P8452_22199 [Trifolium repens]|nr:hypothetical protein P8452_22199 [Trifolium repens]